MTRGYMALVYYALFNGFVGVFVKATQGLDILSIIFFRAFIAMAFVGLVCLIVRRGATLRLCHCRATFLVGMLQGASVLSSAHTAWRASAQQQQWPLDPDRSLNQLTCAPPLLVDYITLPPPPML